LNVETGQGAPAWLFAADPAKGIGRPQFSDNMGAGPYPWDPVYQDLALNMTAHVGALLGGNPRFLGMYVSGATAHYDEMILLKAPDGAGNYLAHPASPAGLTQGQPVPALEAGCPEYIDAWKRSIDTMPEQTGVPVVTPLDRVFAAGQDDVPCGYSVYDAINTYKPDARLTGTVNVSYYQNKDQNPVQNTAYWDPLRQFADRFAPHTGERTFWEIGPLKMIGNPPPTVSEMKDHLYSILVGGPAANLKDVFAPDYVTILQGTWKYQGGGATSLPIRQAACLAVQHNPHWYETYPSDCNGL
jgi:hypothetical protein